MKGFLYSLLGLTLLSFFTLQVLAAPTSNPPIGGVIKINTSTQKAGIGMDPDATAALGVAGNLLVNQGNIQMYGTYGVVWGGGNSRIQGDGQILSLYGDGIEGIRIGAGGRVGLGTTSPKNSLDIGNATGNKGISFGGTGGNYANIWTKYSNGNLVLATGVYPPSNQTGFESSYGGSAMGRAAIELGAFTDPGDIIFYTNPSSTVADGTAITMNERMRIAENGNVGIGTTTPGTRLEIKSAGDPSTSIRVQRSSNTSSIFDVYESGGNGAMSLYDSAGNEDVKFHPNSASWYNGAGNFGIGTLTPASKLEVNGDLRISGGNSLVLRDGGAQIYSPAVNEIQFHTNGTNRVKIGSTGNVGIGTTDPVSLLNLKSTARTDIRFDSDINTNGSEVSALNFLGKDSAGNLNAYGQINSYIISNTDGSETGGIRFQPGGFGGDFVTIRGDNGGRVGIGTTTPGTKLEVNGQVKITGGSPGAGKVLTSDSTGLATWESPVQTVKIVNLASDVATTSSSYSDVTGLSFSVSAGVAYRFKAMMIYTTSTTSNGPAWSINGPTSPTMLSYRVSYTTLAGNGGSESAIGSISSYDGGPATGSSATTNNLVIIEGIITPSAAGTVTMRFRSESTGWTTTVKAGSSLQWW